MVVRRWIALCAVCLLVGCARGGEDVTDGGGAGEGGVIRRDGAVVQRDGAILRDAGPGGCEPRGYAATCPDASPVGPLAPGEHFESELGLVARGAAQWMRVTFPPVASDAPDGGVASAAGGGVPTIRFLRNEGDVYRLEIRTACVGVASCGEGGTGTPGAATDLTEWSFEDDPALSEEGEGRFSTRDVVWPEALYVRVYPRGDPRCGLYQIEIAR